jgi:hypothetical protein
VLITVVTTQEIHPTTAHQTQTIIAPIVLTLDPLPTYDEATGQTLPTYEDALRWKTNTANVNH